MMRQLDLVVRECLLLGEEDEPDAGLLAPRSLDQDRYERSSASASASPPVVAEPVVVCQLGRSENLLPGRSILECFGSADAFGRTAP